MRYPVSMIVAHDRNGAIGKGNTIPWRCKKDMELFKQLTLTKTIVMGYNTAVSLGRALPQRRNVVLTSREAPWPGMEVVRSIDEALALGEIMVIGGAQVYNAFHPYTDLIHLSQIHTVVEDPDCFFQIPEEYEYIVDKTDVVYSPAGQPDFTYQRLLRCK